MTQRAELLAFMLSRRGEWIPSYEIAAVGGLQYGARLKEIRDGSQGYVVESRVQRVRTGARSHVVHSWFRLCTDRQAAASAIGQGKAKPEQIAAAMKDESQPNLFSEPLMERHRDDG